MTNAQKIIKYFALALAAVIIVSIISGILSFLGILTGITANTKNTSTIEMQGTDFENTELATLNIKVAYTKLTIKTGKTLTAQTNNTNITCKQNNNKIEITEKSHNWFSNNNNEELIVYIPEDFTFENVDIDAGAGQVNIETLATKEILFKLGAGKVQINNLVVLDKAKIEGGAGKLEIASANINNLDLDMGIGETKISGAILGNSKINAGVGALNINLEGKELEYKIKASKGIGSIRIAGKEIADGETSGNGENRIDVNGGIGSINIKFTDMN